MTAATPAAILAATALGLILADLIGIYLLIMLGAILLSWFPLEPGTPMFKVWRVLRQLTDPVLEPLRRIIPPIGGMIDISPMIAFIVLLFIQGLLRR